MPIFYDTHAHLDYPDYATDLATVIERAASSGIRRIIAIGTDLESSARAVKLSDRFPSVYAVVGWHPCQASEAPEDLRPALRELARHSKVVGLGETGLDHYRLPSAQGGSPADDESFKRKQAELFRQHLELASELDLNCVIHQRDAFDEVITELAPFANKVRGVFHCFVGSPAEMQRVVALGSLVSFTGIITFKNASSIRDTVAATPLNRFMLETDSPYLAPVPFRGKRCEPAFVKEIAEAAASMKGCSPDELSEATCATAHQFFPKLA
jgi:TatD DNase family protein